jgi:hypothetical protein
MYVTLNKRIADLAMLNFFSRSTLESVLRVRLSPQSVEALQLCLIRRGRNKHHWQRSVRIRYTFVLVIVGANSGGAAWHQIPFTLAAFPLPPYKWGPPTMLGLTLPRLLPLSFPHIHILSLDTAGLVKLTLASSHYPSPSYPRATFVPKPYTSPFQTLYARCLPLTPAYVSHELPIYLMVNDQFSPPHRLREHKSRIASEAQHP